MTEQHVVLQPATVRVKVGIPKVVVNGLVTTLLETPATDDDWRTLSEIARKFATQDASAQQLEERIRSETPFEGILRYLADSRTQALIMTIVVLIVTIILEWPRTQDVVIIEDRTGNDTKIEQRVEEISDEVIRRLDEIEEKLPPPHPPPSSPPPPDHPD